MECLIVLLIIVFSCQVHDYNASLLTFSPHDQTDVWTWFLLKLLQEWKLLQVVSSGAAGLLLWPAACFQYSWTHIQFVSLYLFCDVNLSPADWSVLEVWSLSAAVSFLFISNILSLSVCSCCQWISVSRWCGEDRTVTVIKDHTNKPDM